MIPKNEDQGTGALDPGTGRWGIEPRPIPFTFAESSRGAVEVRHAILYVFPDA